MTWAALIRILVLALVLVAAVVPARAEPIANPIARFDGLDKISGNITSFDVYINETVQFGSLQITPRVCYTEPASETTQRTAVFVEVDQVSLSGTSRRIFTGWMFADSPALNAIDDAVYDFWLVDCKQRTALPPPVAINPPEGPGPNPINKASSTPIPPAAAPINPDTANSGISSPPVQQSENGSIITLLSPKATAQKPTSQ